MLIVDEYCRQREMSSFGVIIVSPARGRVSLYAEGKAPVSTLGRRDYLIFSGRSEILDPRRIPSLDMSVEDLSQYHAFAGRSVPFCDVALRGEPKRGGCIKPLAALYPAYEAQNLDFITAPPATWFSFVRSLIELRRRLPAPMTDENRFAWGEAHASAEEILLYRYHMDAANNREGRFAPVVAAPDGGLLLVGTKAPRPITLRMDRLGKVLWRRDLGAKGYRLTPSGSIEIVGHVCASNRSDAGGQRVWRAEVDASGRLLRDEVGEPQPPS